MLAVFNGRDKFFLELLFTKTRTRRHPRDRIQYAFGCCTFAPIDKYQSIRTRAAQTIVELIYAHPNQTTAFNVLKKSHCLIAGCGHLPTPDRRNESY